MAIIEMKKISKSFGQVQVLKDADFTVDKGEIHALLGENGAGKSTLMKILTGIYIPNSGDIYVNNVKQSFKNIKDSESKGISIVNQELNIFPEMTVLENLFMCKEITEKALISKKKQELKAKEIFKRLGLNLDLNERAGNLSVGMQQMIEISKSLLIDADLIIMDEPTAALTEREIESLFQVCNALKMEGKSIVYISHRMKEIFELCDRITILRDGKYVITESLKNLSFDDVVQYMVGYELGGMFPDKPDVKLGHKILEVNNLSRSGNFENISFSVREGEILGFAGLMGAGRTELMNVVFGIDKKSSGTISISGEHVDINSPKKAKLFGLGYVTENRKEEGLFLEDSIHNNVIYNNLEELSTKGVMDNKYSEKLVDVFCKRVNLKCRDYRQNAGDLSGGNQQKIVLAKWLANNPKLLILDEPTRGIDVNSKKQIYELIFRLKELKCAVIVVSSELVELLGICDTIAVMREGKITKILDNNDLTDDEVMKYMMGGS